jgi:hypothetical protein
VKARIGMMIAVAMMEFWFMLFEIELTINPTPAPQSARRNNIKYILINLSKVSRKPTGQ